jgi:hypothetical protein
MKDHILQNAINIIRNLAEDAPTMAAGTGGFTGDADPKGPVAGFDTVIKFDGRSKIARRLPPPYRKSLSKKRKDKK